MPQPKKAPRFGGSPAHHKHLMSNLVTELFRHGRIRTTAPKANTVQPLAERMITFAKRGDVHARRQVLKVIRDKDVVHKLFADIGPAFADRNGGYTRVVKLGPRKGDAAPMAIIELVQGVDIAGQGELEEAPRRRWSLRRSKGTLSATARQRQEDQLAAIDAGEEPVPVDETGEMAEAVPPGRLEAKAAADSDEEETPEVTAEEVERRLAAEDDAAEDEAEAADEADAADESADEDKA